MAIFNTKIKEANDILPSNQCSADETHVCLQAGLAVASLQAVFNLKDRNSEENPLKRKVDLDFLNVLAYF